MACWRTPITTRLKQGLHLSAALLSLPLLAAAAEAENALAISLESLPPFVFMDDHVQFVVLVRQERERPPTDEGQTSRRAFVIFGNNADTQQRQEANVPPYCDRAAMCRWTINMKSLPHGAELVCKAMWAEEPSAQAVEERAVVLHADKSCSALKAHGDHLRDQAGRRVILAVPRRQDAEQRRWLPLRLLAVLKERERRNILLAGGLYGGSTRYAEIFRDLWREQGNSDCRLLLAKESERPILELVAMVLDSADGCEVALLFPGTEDARLSVPLEEYYLGLHAAAAAMESRGHPAILTMAIPPPSPAAFGRVERYRQTARRVAEERGWRHVAMPAATPHETILVRRVPSEDDQRRAAASLVAGAAPFSRQEALLLSPLLLLAVISLAVLWLWLFARADRLLSAQATKN